MAACAACPPLCLPARTLPLNLHPTEDQRKGLEAAVQKLTDDYVKQVGWGGGALPAGGCCLRCWLQLALRLLRAAALLLPSALLLAALTLLLPTFSSCLLPAPPAPRCAC